MPKRSASVPITFDSLSTNGCPSLLEVDLFAPQGANESDFVIGADVRFGSMTLTANEWARSVEFGLSSAVLRLTLQGCKMAPGSARFGDQRPTTLVTAVKTEKTKRTRTSAAIRGGLKGSISSHKGNAAAEAQAKVEKGGSLEITDSAHKKMELRDDPVVALSDNRWKFTAVHCDYMQSRYLGDETLCKLQITSKQARVEGHLLFLPKDLFLIDGDDGGWPFLDVLRRSPNKTAIAKILLAKHLRQMNPLPDGGGPIIGSVSTLTAELGDG
jgi:hypothetical protein